MERYKAHLARIVNQASKNLSTRVKNVLSKMESLNKTTINTAIYEVNRLIDDDYTVLEDTLLVELKELLSSQLTWVSVREEYEIEEEEQQGLVASILGGLILGKTLTDHLKDGKRSLKNDILTRLRIAATDNIPLSQAITSVVGKASLGRKDGVFVKNAKGIEAVVSTTIQSIVNQAKMKIWEFIHTKKYIWLSVLDSRTTPICRARSNRIYPVGQGPLPPAHMRCRSTVAMWHDDMEIPQSYEQWLRTQPRSVVEDILGKKKAQLFLDGKVSLKRFVTPSGRELTLKELQQRLDII